MLDLIRTFGLFLITAIAEIAGCYFPYLWLRGGKSGWFLLPGAAALFIYAWLLTLHPTEAGRTYAAYGGIYVIIAIALLWFIEGVVPNRWDTVGMLLILAGSTVIALAPRG